MATVSVVIPTYNHAESLPRAVNSVLNQTHEDLELIVVDDGSTDQTQAAMDDFSDSRITYTRHNSNRGGSAARNTGLELSSGEFIAFLDADDEWKKQKLDIQVRYLRSLPDEWGACYCGANLIRSGVTGELRDTIISYLSTETTKREGGPELIPSIITRSFSLGGSSTLMITSEVATQLNGFDESFDRYQDLEFLIRLLDVTRIAYIPLQLVVKHDSGNPSPGTLEATQKKFLNKFSEEISRWGMNESRTYAVHKNLLGAAYLRDGQISEGVKRLDIHHTTGVMGISKIIWALVLAVRSKLRSRFDSRRE